MSQKITRPQNNLHCVFDYFDKLYYETSQVMEERSNLFKVYYPSFFHELIALFVEYDSKYRYLDTTPIDVRKLKLPNYNSKNIILCFSGGKDSIVAALQYKKLGYNVHLYHLRNINKSYPKEYQNAEKVAHKLGLPLYTEYLTLSGNHTYTEHPLKNIIIANSALQFGIRNNIGIKIAFGNYYTALLRDNKFDICAGDCRDMWGIYEKIIRNIIPTFKMYIPLRNVKTTLKALENHTDLLELACSCLSPYRYQSYWKRLNEKKYNVRLPENRCATCWKCSLEYIYYTDHSVWEYNEAFYKHCLEMLLRNSLKENTKIYSIYQLWNSYLFYPIKQSKLKGIENAIIQTDKIKFTENIE